MDVHHDHVEHPTANERQRMDQRKIVRRKTHLTAGAKFERLTIPNPALLTAALCNNPSSILRPTGILSISEFPISRTKNDTQSVRVSRVMKATRNQVWCEGKR